jgi:hypothetical protein
MTALVVVLALVAVAVVAWLFLRLRHPPDNEDWPVERTGTSEQLYGGVGGVDRPAGPDAESMDPSTTSKPERPPA